MNRESIKGVWRRVGSAITRQRYRSDPHNRNEDQIELFTLRSQPSSFSLSSISSTLRNPRTFFLKNNSTNQSNDQIVITEQQWPGSVPRAQRERWIIGVRQCARVGAFILLLNLVFILTAAGVARGFSDNKAFSTSSVLYQGECGTTKRWDVSLHLVINGLSTFILGASNYCMQSLVAPTREEVDAAHARGDWLDIGCASLKNLRAIGRRRLTLWIILMITATPFHLLYNSMLFESLSTNEFGAIVGPKDLNSSNVHSLTTPALDRCFGVPSYLNTPHLNWTQLTSYIANGDYEKRKFSDCVGSSHTGTRAVIMLAENLTVSDGGNATILATDNSLDFFTNSVVAIPYFNSSGQCQDAEPVYNWYEDAYYAYANENYYNPALVTYDAQECLVIHAPQHCQLLYSPPICLVIALAAFAKVCSMFMAARISRKRGKPLLTVGDAIASFISNPDPTTKNLCWLTGKDVRKGVWKPLRGPENEIVYKNLTKPKRWMHAPTRWRWFATLSLCFACIATSIWLLLAAMMGMPYDAAPFMSPATFSTLFSSSVTENDYGTAVIPGEGVSMLTYVVVANMPQLLVTMCYYCYNAVLSSMLAASEFDSYAKKRKALRVHWPVRGSGQRSTYWLSIPYRYSIPVLGLYMALHWMISQAVFYLWLIPYSPLDEVTSGSISSIGFSSSYIFLAILIGGVMLTVPCCLAFRKFKSNMPLAGSCSAAISAACHPPAHEDLSKAVLGKVQWGQVNSLPEQPIDSLQPNHSENGHCTFTSLETVKPTLTQCYA